MSEMRRHACCVLCDEELYEALQRWPNDHPLAGGIMRTGRELPIMRVETVVLAVSGNRADLSLCDKCEITPENLPLIWRKICALSAFEVSDDGMLALGGQPYETDEKRDWSHKVQRLLMLDVPLGSLGGVRETTT